MPDIHPSAIIEGDVTLPDDVRIGPWCVLRGQIELGPGCVLHERVTLEGPLKVGRDNVFYPGAVVGGAPQDRHYDPHHPGAGVVVGDRNVLREHMTIHRATGDQPTRLGNDNYLMVNVHVAHDCVIGDGTTMANSVALAGFVTIENGVVMGGNSGVHQFCRIGRLTMISGATALTQDVPPFCTVYLSRQVGSLNIVGLRRAGFRSHVPALKDAFRLLYRSRLSRREAVARIRRYLGHDPLCQEFADFVDSTRRGVTRYGGRIIASTVEEQVETRREA